MVNVALALPTCCHIDGFLCLHWWLIIARLPCLVSAVAFSVLASSLQSSKKTSKGQKASNKGGESVGAERPPNYGPGLYCCTFTLCFTSSDTHYVASCYPYSYTDLQVRPSAHTTRVLLQTCSAPSRHHAMALVQIRRSRLFVSTLMLTRGCNSASQRSAVRCGVVRRARVCSCACNA